jgi:hypothetical protein
MPNIDVPIEADLRDLFKLPECHVIKLPSPKPLKVRLPSGGTIQAFGDISKGIPNDCSLTFSLMLQIAPLLASMDCLLKILKLIKPLIDIVNGLPIPPVKAIQEFVKAAADLAPCLLIPTPASILPFLKDLLCLIIKALNCFLGQMKTLLAMMNGISLQLLSAQTAGDAEGIALAECAQKNAEAQASQLTASIEPIGVILELAGALFGIAGVEPIKLPQIGSQTDLDSLNKMVETIQGVVGTLQTVAEGLGGCD